MDHQVENAVAAEAINKVLLGALIQQTDEALSQKTDHQNPILFLQLERLRALLQQIANAIEDQPTMPPDSIRGSLDRTRDAIQLATSIISRSQKRRRCIDFIACVPKTSREIKEWTSTFDEQFQDLEMDLSVWLSAQQIVRQAVSQIQLPVPEPDVLLQPVPDSGFVGSNIKFAELGATPLFQALLPTLPWNTLMDKMMGEMHDQGKTISDIEESLKTIPLYPKTITTIKFAFSMGCELRIVSDANMFFIKTILQAHDLLQYFTEIKTNPAFVDEKGRLRIQPFHPFTEGPPHGCSLCPPNMCKGVIIDEIMRKSLEGESVDKKQFIYLGDGSGDFCPSLKLRDGDHVLPRKEYPLWKLIQKNRDLVKAEVHEWSNAKDVEDLFVKLLKP